MMLIVRWIVNTLAVMLVANVVPGIAVRDFYTALLVALVYGLMNAIVRPLLLILTLPINLLTLGLFTFVLNALLFWLVARIVPGFNVAGFMPAFWGALILWAVSYLTSALLRES
ncbi:phage holin family protein [Patescibacteria group bacterium]|nr:MAG: phage holin family protein [Patescibacteria group bacterium]